MISTENERLRLKSHIFQRECHQENFQIYVDMIFIVEYETQNYKNNIFRCRGYAYMVITTM